MNLFDEIIGLRPLSDEDRKVIAEYEAEMRQTVVPRIIADIRRRRSLSEDARQRAMATLSAAAKEVQPTIDRERAGERISEGLMEFRMR